MANEDDTFPKRTDSDGYRGAVESSLEDRFLHGRLLCIRDMATCESKDRAEVRAHFIEAVDIYVEYLEDAVEAEPNDPDEQAEIVEGLPVDDRGKSISYEQATAEGDRRPEVLATPMTKEQLDAEARFADEIFHELNDPDPETDRKIDETIRRGQRRTT